MLPRLNRGLAIANLITSSSHSLWVLLTDRSESSGKERFVGYFEINVLSIELGRVVFLKELKLTS